MEALLHFSPTPEQIKLFFAMVLGGLSLYKMGEIKSRDSKVVSLSETKPAIYLPLQDQTTQQNNSHTNDQ